MIHVECYADFHFINSLGFDANIIRHQRGKGEVIKALNQFGGIGIIDEDPGCVQPRDIKNKIYEHKDQLDKAIFLQNSKSSDKFLIILMPRFEEWILSRAEAVNIKPADYLLPETGEKLHRLKHYEKGEDYQRFLSEILARDKDMNKIKQWIKQVLYYNQP